MQVEKGREVEHASPFLSENHPSAAVIPLQVQVFLSTHWYYRLHRTTQPVSQPSLGRPAGPNLVKIPDSETERRESFAVFLLAHHVGNAIFQVPSQLLPESILLLSSPF